MKNKTCEDAADAVIKAGSGKGLIVEALKAVFSQGFERGVRARASIYAKAKEAKGKAMDAAFKSELDQIEDVRISKWE